MHNMHSIMHTIVIILVEYYQYFITNNNNNNTLVIKLWMMIGPDRQAWPRRHDVPRSRRLHQYLGTTRVGVLCTATTPLVE